jgi:PDZ domain-containing protein
MVTAWIDREQAVVPEGAIFPPGQSAEQATEENRLEMASSQQSATAAALRALGHEVTEEVRIAGFSAGSPSEGELRAGDVIVSVEGAPTSDGETLREALQQVTPGKPAELVVRRDGSEVSVSPLTRKNDSGATALGIMVEPLYVFPFQVEIQIDNVGGSSAGTMFALGIIDKLTPGALTGGLTFAGTGTITADGDVGPIGFIQQKMYGARDAGARYFLAPRENCDEVAGYEPDGLSVIAVSTLAEARAAVEQIGSGKGEAGLPRCG